MGIFARYQKQNSTYNPIGGHIPNGDIAALKE